MTLQISSDAVNNGFQFTFSTHTIRTFMVSSANSNISDIKCLSPHRGTADGPHKTTPLSDMSSVSHAPINHISPLSSPTPNLSSKEPSVTKLRSRMRITSTPPASPEQKKPQLKEKSAIRSALERTSENSPKGLLKYLKKATPEEYKSQVQRDTAKRMDLLRDCEGVEVAAKEERRRQVREGERLRQQAHRKKKYALEIARGERTPCGSKRKVRGTVI
jgi:hypothetical protein